MTTPELRNDHSSRHVEKLAVVESRSRHVGASRDGATPQYSRVARSPAQRGCTGANCSALSYRQRGRARRQREVEILANK
jgi:hypothetical protein